MTERKIVTLDDVERRLISIHNTAYYNWIRHVVTLSSGALTLLIGLQKHYVPDSPQHLWLLKVCWVALALSIALGVVALYGEAQTPLDAVKNIRKNRKKHGDQIAAEKLQLSSGTNPKKGYLYSQMVLPWCFSTALTCLSLFAVLNL